MYLMEMFNRCNTHIGDLDPYSLIGHLKRSNTTIYSILCSLLMSSGSQL